MKLQFDHNDLFKIFDSMVTPVLTYGAEIWGNVYAPAIEQFQNLSRENTTDFVIRALCSDHVIGKFRCKKV